MENFIRLNIAFKMPKEIAEEAINLSSEIAKNNDAFFMLDGKEYFPHITIYQPEFPEKNIDKVIDAVEKIAEKFSSLLLEYTSTIAEKGWIGVYVNNSKLLKDIHEEFVINLNPLREDHLRDKYKNTDHCQMISEEQRNNILTYGYSTLMSLYAPHLTITRLQSETEAERVAKQLIWKLNEFRVDTVGIFVGGEHGTCRKLLKEFKLKNER